ncbi:MAG: hypothetical protein MJ231_03745 [bacterium]|nr:hypothetical protein [bacterium]
MEDKIKTFKHIMDKSDSNRVIILTNHYQITGNVHECEECNKGYYINLTDAIMCNIEEAYGAECTSGTQYDWLHVDLDKVLAYSFI